MLSVCFEGAVTQRQALLSVWTRCTSTHDVTIAADVNSSGPARCGADRNDDQTLREKADTVALSKTTCLLHTSAVSL